MLNACALAHMGGRLRQRRALVEGMAAGGPCWRSVGCAIDRPACWLAGGAPGRRARVCGRRLPAAGSIGSCAQLFWADIWPVQPWASFQHSDEPMEPGLGAWRESLLDANLRLNWTPATRPTGCRGRTNFSNQALGALGFGPIRASQHKGGRT